MTGDFWARARAPKYPHHPALRATQAAYNRPQTAPPEKADEPPGDIAAIAALDTVAYAQNRDAILAEFGGGPRSGEWMGGVEKGTGQPALTASQMTDLGRGGYGHATTGYESRPRGIAAADCPTDLAGHSFRGVERT